MFSISPRLKRLSCVLAFFMALSQCLTLFLTPAKAVSKAELDALKRQQSQLAEQRAGIQAQLDELSSKVAFQTEKLELLSAQLDLTNTELENLSRQIAIYTTSIGEMENELKLKEQEKQELLERYKTRIRAMEENGSYTYLSILLGASNFQDFLSRIDCIKEIMEYDNGLINEVQEAHARVKKAKEDMEAEMAAQQKVFEEYQDKQADLIAQQEEVKAVLESLTADSAEYEAQLASVSELQASLDKQIRDMEDKLAELARIQAEQAAARNKTSNNNKNNNNNNNNSNWYGDSAGTGTGQDIINYAMNFLGVKYVYGGTSPSGFDCSGLVYYCYRHFGYSVNRTAAGLAYSGTEVSSSDLQPGDIILFTSGDGSYIGHTGLYVGNGQFIHAPHTGDVVKISSLADGYYKEHYWGARRVAA